MNKGTVGTSEQVDGWQGKIVDVLDEVAKGDMVDDASGGGGLVGEGMRIGVRGNGCFL